MASGKSTRPPARGKNPVTGARPGGNRRATGGGSRRANQRGNRRAPTIRHRQTPWLLIISIVVVLALVAGVGLFLFIQHERTGKFRYSESNRDPSLQIDGVVTQSYEGQHHVRPNQRVAYDRTPPYGGPHDGYWAACNGIVYPTAVRNENMVHALEHGAVWIAYDPARVTGDALDTLAEKVRNRQYTIMSPYPGLDRPVSLQSWGHQLKVDGVDDDRIDQFILALRQNPYTYPEVGASCDALGPGAFDPDNPPPFDPSPYGPGTLPMNYTGDPATNTEATPSGGGR